MLRILVNYNRDKNKRPIFMTAKDEELENIYNHYKEKILSIQEEISQNLNLPHFYLKSEMMNHSYICYQIENYLKEQNIPYLINEEQIPNKITIDLSNERTK